MDQSATQALNELYLSERENIYGVAKRCPNVTGPFLVSPNEKYFNNKVKVAFVGQETKGWTNESDIKKQMRTYKDFNLAENYKHKSSPFWSVMRKLENELCAEQRCSAWLNINRYAENEKRPSQKTLVELTKLDSILVAELTILNPDVIIFLTGHSYDSRITKMLNAHPSAIEGIDVKTLCSLNSDVIKGRIFRTYHPNYLRRSGIENLVINAISKGAHQC